MSQHNLYKTDSRVEEDRRPSTDSQRLDSTPRAVGHDDIAGLLSQMTLNERIRAYRSGVFSHRELCNAAAREPDRMPLRNGEFEWIALSLADLD
jgi:hypothetical protein